MTDNSAITEPRTKGMIEADIAQMEEKIRALKKELTECITTDELRNKFIGNYFRESYLGMDRICQVQAISVNKNGYIELHGRSWVYTYNRIGVNGYTINPFWVYSYESCGEFDYQPISADDANSIVSQWAVDFAHKILSQFKDEPSSEVQKREVL